MYTQLYIFNSSNIHIYKNVNPYSMKGLSVTHQCSVWRSVQYTSNNDDYWDHYKSYKSSKHYSPFWLHSDKVACIGHEQGQGKGTQHLCETLHINCILLDSYDISNVI
jgi:hypothetical protein